ncbi:unnamed protein product [Rhizoctonia solani]|uniref:Uncharacterized protein n=1 Tax=Rhizoctonia solani TaxID=456999 RepID=A0A8H3A5Z4_9AGAM|nr:unnamed protein product [Rhizoctonia solani]
MIKLRFDKTDVFIQFLARQYVPFPIGLHHPPSVRWHGDYAQSLALLTEFFDHFLLRALPCKCGPVENRHVTRIEMELPEVGKVLQALNLGGRVSLDRGVKDKVKLTWLIKSTNRSRLKLAIRHDHMTLERAQ